jgi:ParB family chromosome partitioning protein
MLELFRKLPIDQILRSSHQARKDFDYEGLVGMSESLRQEGLQNPITVRLMACTDADCRIPRLDSMEGFPPCPEGTHWHGELIAGERRLRAAGILGWTVIDAKVIQTVSEAEASVKGLIENVQRKSLNPIEEAEGIQGTVDLKDEHWTQEQIGKVLGKSQSHVSETMRLLDLSEQIKENIRRRIITPEHGAELLRLPVPELREKVADQIVKQGMNVKKTRNVVAKFLKSAKTKEKKTGRPSMDFMASVWPGLEANTDIKACGYWDVAFKKNKWVITMGAEAIGSKQEFADWFRQVAEALASPPPISDEEEQRQAAMEDAKRFGKLGRPI